MIVDLRTYTMVPGHLNAWLKLYETDGYPIHVRHLGKPMGIFTTDVGTLNQVVSVSDDVRPGFSGVRGSSRRSLTRTAQCWTSSRVRSRSSSS
jgi:NIPSNAP